MTDLVVVSSGLRSPSSTRMLADRLAAAGGTALRAEPQLIEVREVAKDITEALLTGFNSPRLQDALDAVEHADALIVVTPTFQGSYAGLFKSFIDLISAEAMRRKPVLLAATGGTERHSLVIEHAIRPLFSYLGAATVPTGIYAATQDFGADTAALDQRVERAVQELAALASLHCSATNPAPGRVDGAAPGSAGPDGAAPVEADPANRQDAAPVRAEAPTRNEALEEAQRELARGTGQRATDFGELLRSLGQD